MEPQIHMWAGHRAFLIARHDFFVTQMKARVLTHFQNIEDEAEKYAESEYDRIGSLPGNGNFDMADAAEVANDRAQEFYGLLCDMKVQMTLGGLAALYHQWEKDFRDFMERELNRSFDQKEVSKICWSPNIGKMFDILTEFGWEVRQLKNFPRIEAFRLVVNVYKHGKGRSLDELACSYPQYLKGPFTNDPEIPSFFKSPDFEDLSVSDDEFEELAGALRCFWADFPERLLLSSSK